MGIIARHPDAPLVDGEVASAVPVEADFATLFEEFNGNVDAANLGTGSVTTDKLAATAVTQAKMTSGAASASEAQVEVGATGTAVTASFTNIGSAITHAVGNPARHVVIMVSFNTQLTGPNELRMKILKDSVNMTPNVTDKISNLESSSAFVTVTRVYIDDAPTAGGTHVYQFQASTALPGSGNIFNLAIVAFEPRS